MPPLPYCACVGFGNNLMCSVTVFGGELHMYLRSPPHNSWNSVKCIHGDNWPISPKSCRHEQSRSLTQLTNEVWAKNFYNFSFIPITTPTKITYIHACILLVCVCMCMCVCMCVCVCLSIRLLTVCPCAVFLSHQSWYEEAFKSKVSQAVVWDEYIDLRICHKGKWNWYILTYCNTHVHKWNWYPVNAWYWFQTQNWDINLHLVSSKESRSIWTLIAYVFSA